VDVSGSSEQDPVTEYKAIRAELAEHRPELPLKPTIVVATKMDVAIPEKVRKLQRWCRQNDVQMIKISSVTGEGLDELKQQVFIKLSAADEVKHGS
jgi:GTP-binding protein